VRDHRPGVTFRLRASAATAAIALAVTTAGIVISPAALAAPAVSASRLITLINGDRLDVRATPGGNPMIALEPGAATGSLLSLRLGGGTYELPADALPYLGRGLDPDLFSLSYLSRIERGGRLPLAISYSGRRPSLPGVVITRSGHGSASGYLTAASARVFGAALERQFRADHQRATYGQDGLFAGRVQIALAGAPAAAQPRPFYQMHTLTVRGRDQQGRPDTGDTITVFNAANPEIFGVLFEGSSFFYRGQARFSVPAGTYWAIGDFITPNFTAEKLTVLPQFRVRGNTTITVSERAATSEITTATPRPAVTQQVEFEMIRTGQPGVVNSATWIDNGLALWVSPTTRRPTYGGFRTYTSATLTSPPGTRGVPYTYNLQYQGPNGLIPPQHYVVTTATTATVTERFYQGVKTAGGWVAFGFFPAQLGLLFAQVVQINLPGVQTQYFSAAPDLVWQAEYQEFLNENTGGQSDSFRILAPGQQLTEDWGAYPLHPQPDVQLLTGKLAELLPEYPSAFRIGSQLYLGESPFSDSYPGHYGFGYEGVPGSTSIDSYAVYQNGRRIADGNPVYGIAPVGVSQKPSVIRFEQSTATWGAEFPLSPSSTTVWTWRTRAEPNAKVPGSWFCGVTAAFKTIQRCAVQPLLTLGYQVQGLSLTGLTPAGPQQVNLSVGHLQASAAAAVTGATASYSLNDGQSWRRAAVTGAGAGQFQIGFSAPAGVDVTLRVSATDAAGGSITETIVRAYGVAL
jgi:hypothetical protein